MKTTCSLVFVLWVWSIVLVLGLDHIGMVFVLVTWLIVLVLGTPVLVLGHEYRRCSWCLNFSLAFMHTWYVYVVMHTLDLKNLGLIISSNPSNIGLRLSDHHTFLLLARYVPNVAKRST